MWCKTCHTITNVTHVSGDEGLTRDQGCDSGSSVTSGDQDRNVAALSQTCVMLQSQVCHNDNIVMILHMFVTQVDTLQRNLASVIQFVSERSRHSSSSQDTPPLRSGHMMTASLDLNQQPPPTTTLPSSMTMSLPPSLLLPAPVTLSKSCDSLAQVCKRLNYICYVLRAETWILPAPFTLSKFCLGMQECLWTLKHWDITKFLTWKDIKHWGANKNFCYWCFKSTFLHFIEYLMSFIPASIIFLIS